MSVCAWIVKAQSPKKIRGVCKGKGKKSNQFGVSATFDIDDKRRCVVKKKLEFEYAQLNASHVQ